MNYRKCKYCNSEFVSWNWVHSPFWATWFINFSYYKFPYFRYDFWNFFDRYYGECWNCDHGIQTFFKVKNGMPDEEREEKFVHLPKHGLRRNIEELWWIQDQSKYFTKNEKHKFEHRLNNLISSIKENFDEQWELDNQIRPESKIEDESYKNHLHSAYILKALED